jgi:type II secretion system protein H
MLRLPADQRGFTLVELMVLIGIIGLLAAIGVPTFNGYLRANEIDATGDRLASDLALARATAVSQGRIIRFTSDDSGYTITDPGDGRTLRDREFGGSIELVTPETVDFFPWGAADTVLLTLSDGHEQREVRVLPTGMAEVGP